MYGWSPIHRSKVPIVVGSILSGQCRDGMAHQSIRYARVQQVGSCGCHPTVPHYYRKVGGSQVQHVGIADMKLHRLSYLVSHA